MVLYKRRPVKFEPLPKSVEDNSEVWVIEETGEVFLDYEKFLNRRDFYEQKKFTCESTGHSGYTFFEAKESETEGSREVNSILPDGLRSRVLQFVQFQTTSRMDDLVNIVFDEFKEQFQVKDRVSIEGDNSRRYGTITSITDNSQLHRMFAEQSMDDDSVRSYQYEVTMDDDPNDKVMRYRASELQRDKKFYSKLIIKAFLRNTTKRAEWVGAPWMVTDHLVKRYGIPTKIADMKIREAAIARKKAANANLSNGTGPPLQQSFPQNATNGHPAQLNGHRQPLPVSGHGQATFVNFSANAPQRFAEDLGRHPQLPPHLQHMHGPPPFSRHQLPPHFYPSGPPTRQGHIPPWVTNPGAPPPYLAQQMQLQPPPQIQQQHQQRQNQQAHGATALLMQQNQQQPLFQTSFVHNQNHQPANVSNPQHAPQLAKPFEPIKYPMEDLEIRQPKTYPVRPSLKFFSDDVPEGAVPLADERKTGIMMKSIGPLLCAWETLNVHDTVYMLDSFTFDDFVDAMCFSDDEVECELFVEVHCSILKQIVNSTGKLQTPLPRMTELEESDEEKSSKESTPTPEPEPPVRTTRSSLRKSEAQQIVKPRTPSPEPPREMHNAEKFVESFDWTEQCKVRDFRDGGWQAIVVALLHRLSFDPLQKDACDEILAQLVPAEEEPTVESIATNYVNLDVNLRIAALDLILRLTVATEDFRNQLVAAAQEMTRLRKEKIDHQRKRKELADELFKLDLERKIHLPANTPASPSDTKENDDVDVSMISIASDMKDVADTEGNDVEEPSGTKVRLRHSNKNKRKAAAEEARKERAKKVKAEAEKTKKQKEWEKLLDSIEKKKDELKECEANINELDDDLRETLVHRSKVLGKDRFLNKYYWFEHNGMPFGGVPNSSTAEYGYANGRIWVQGPDEHELQPNLEEPAVSQDKHRLGFTVPQRKAKEEGETHLTKSTEWAYYDDPEDLDKLMTWLDERGVRERQLRKELQTFRDRIIEYMDKMKKHLSDASRTEEVDDEDNDKDATTRVSTRNKAAIEHETPEHRCLLWTNSIMRDEYGYNHSEEYEPPKKGKPKPVKSAKSKGRR